MAQREQACLKVRSVLLDHSCCPYYLCKENGDDRIQMAANGIAGENPVRFAAVVNGYTGVSSRSSAGCITGSKNLKVVAVRGTTDVTVAHSFVLSFIESSVSEIE